MAGGEALDPAGTDFAIRYVRASWKYHGITAVQLAEDLAGLPAKLDHVDELAADGIIGGEEPNAADLQIGSTIRVLLTIGDLRPLIEGRRRRGDRDAALPRLPGRDPGRSVPGGLGARSASAAVAHCVRDDVSHLGDGLGRQPVAGLGLAVERLDPAFPERLARAPGELRHDHRVRRPVVDVDARAAPAQVRGSSPRLRG